MPDNVQNLDAVCAMVGAVVPFITFGSDTFRPAIRCLVAALVLAPRAILSTLGHPILQAVHTVVSNIAAGSVGGICGLLETFAVCCAESGAGFSGLVESGVLNSVLTTVFNTAELSIIRVAFLGFVCRVCVHHPDIMLQVLGGHLGAFVDLIVEKVFFMFSLV